MIEFEEDVADRLEEALATFRLGVCVVGAVAFLGILAGLGLWWWIL